MAGAVRQFQPALENQAGEIRLTFYILFLANAVCILSNAIETRVGAFSADWEYFFPWLRAEDEKEKVDRKGIEAAGTSLEAVLAGLLPKARLLDYVENFVLYHRGRTKIVAQTGCW